MADIELVIKIPEEIYDRCRKYGLYCGEAEVLESAVSRGTPIPKGHGELIDRKLVLSDGGLCEFHRYDDYVKMRNYLKSIPPIVPEDKEE